MTTFRTLLNQFGLDQAIFYSIGLRAWQMLAGPVTLFLIAKHFTPVQQGFYYTFGSILTLQMFFEMGLSFVIVQFVSHEFAHLRWQKMGRVSGGHHLKRFKALLIKSFRWYLVVSILFFIVLLPWGHYFFGLKDSGNLSFYWRVPWDLLVFATTLNLLITPLLAVIEGSGRVQEIYRLRLAQTMLGTVFCWTVLVSGGGLYAACAIALCNACVSISWLYSKNRILLKLISSFKTFKHTIKQNFFSWGDEVWPMQWRIAVSWISSYFIYQITVPLLFYYHEPSIAGQMGMSLTLTSTLTLVGQAWLNARAPYLGRLVAKKDWPALDQLFYKVAWQSTSIVFMGGIALVGLVYLLQPYAILHRLLSPLQILFLTLSALLNHLINCLAQYLRSHKKEPFMVLSVISAILFGSTCWICTKYYSSTALVISLFVINLIYGLPFSFLFWLRLKRAWH